MINNNKHHKILCIHIIGICIHIIGICRLCREKHKEEVNKKVEGSALDTDEEVTCF
jgi:hypothetical protein